MSERDLRRRDFIGVGVAEWIIERLRQRDLTLALGQVWCGNEGNHAADTLPCTKCGAAL